MAISQQIKDHIIESYKNGNSIKSINKSVGVSEQTISKILKSAGIEIRKTNYQSLAIDIDNINRLYSSGLSTYQIAEMLGCSDETIRRYISTVRSPKERNKLKPESIDKISKASAKNWLNDEYKLNVKLGKDEQYYNNLRTNGVMNYQKTLGKWISTSEAKSIISDRIKKLWLDKGYRTKQSVWFQERANRLSELAKLALTDPIKRQEWIRKLSITSTTTRTLNGWVSTSQKQLYYILEDSGITFLEEGTETRISPFYVVDCIIPIQQQMKKPLIIEVNGEYWHGLPHIMVKDRQKMTYIERYTDFDLLVLEELEMSNHNQVKSKLESYGINLTSYKFTVSDLEIKTITEEDARIFYSIFHYSSTVRSGAITFGAFYNNKLVAAISYTYPLRTQSATRLGLELHQVMEISRLARQTNIECRNLSSYLIAKTKKLLPKSVASIISFSDSTYGHTGMVYKAAGFVNDGEIEPDYYYLSLHGKYHKKTIWDRAKKMKMKECEYAEKHNLAKIMTGPKTRWVLEL